MAIGMGYPESPEFSARAMAMLTSHDWPGNVRELKNVVERAVYRTGPGTIREVVFDPFLSPYRPAEQAESAAPTLTARDAVPRCAKPDLDIPLARAVRDLEEAYLAAALEQSRHKQKQAADLLGLTYHQFRGLYRRLGAGQDG
jgi:psp operon transcriptional activator